MTELTDADRAALARVSAQIAEGRAAERERLDQRDNLIRQHLAAAVPYKSLMEATGLQRAALDLIRRGDRSRRA